MAGVTDLGVTFDPLGEHLQDPYPIYARARREEPVFFSSRLGMWVLTRFEDVFEVLHQPEVFSSANALRPMVPPHPRALSALGVDPRTIPPAIINSDGEVHAVRRAAAVRGLGPARVTELGTLAQAIVDELVDGFAAFGRVELVEAYAEPLPVRLLAELLGGLNPEDTAVLREHTNVQAELFSVEDADAQVRSIAALRALEELATDLVRRRREQPGDDLVTHILQALAPEDGPLPPEREAGHAVQSVLTVLAAGHSTTTDLLANALWRLLSDRTQWDLVRTCPELVDDAVEELLRHDGPVHGFPRLAVRPARVGGRDFPPGTEFCCTPPPTTTRPVGSAPRSWT